MWVTVPRENVRESDMREHGRKATCEIFPDTSLLDPINMGTNSSARYET